MATPSPNPNNHVNHPTPNQQVPPSSQTPDSVNRQVGEFSESLNRQTEAGSKHPVLDKHRTLGEVDGKQWPHRAGDALPGRLVSARETMENITEAVEEGEVSTPGGVKTGTGSEPSSAQGVEQQIYQLKSEIHLQEAGRLERRHDLVAGFDGVRSVFQGGFDNDAHRNNVETLEKLGEIRADLRAGDLDVATAQRQIGQVVADWNDEHERTLQAHRETALTVQGIGKTMYGAGKGMAVVSVGALGFAAGGTAGLPTGPGAIASGIGTGATFGAGTNLVLSDIEQGLDTWFTNNFLPGVESENTSITYSALSMAGLLERSNTDAGDLTQTKLLDGLAGGVLGGTGAVGKAMLPGLVETVSAPGATLKTKAIEGAKIHTAMGGTANGGFLAVDSLAAVMDDETDRAETLQAIGDAAKVRGTAFGVGLLATPININLPNEPSKMVLDAVVSGGQYMAEMAADGRADEINLGHAGLSAFQSILGSGPGTLKAIRDGQSQSVPLGNASVSFDPAEAARLQRESEAARVLRDFNEQVPFMAERDVNARVGNTTLRMNVAETAREQGLGMPPPTPTINRDVDSFTTPDAPQPISSVEGMFPDRTMTAPHIPEPGMPEVTAIVPVAPGNTGATSQGQPGAGIPELDFQALVSGMRGDQPNDPGGALLQGRPWEAPGPLAPTRSADGGGVMEPGQAIVPLPEVFMGDAPPSRLPGGEPLTPLSSAANELLVQTASGSDRPEVWVTDRGPMGPVRQIQDIPEGFDLSPGCIMGDGTLGPLRSGADNQ